MKICVYTGLFGAYDGLLDQPVAADSGADFICFTDDPTLVSDTWDVRVVSPTFAQDMVRSARMVKILGDPSLDGYDVTVYIDASVRLLATPERIVADWLTEDVDLALATHSYREQLVDEFDEVVRLNYDDRARVYEQLTDYAYAETDCLSKRPLWTGVLVRRRASESLAAGMRTWANHVLRYSRRDQLSVIRALDETAVRYRALDLDNFRTEYHEWPVIERRRISAGKARSLPSGPMLAELRRAHARIEELEAKVVELDPERVHGLVAQIESLRAQIDQGTAERAVLEQRIDHAKRSVGILEERLRAVSRVGGAARNLGRAVVRGTFRRDRG